MKHLLLILISLLLLSSPVIGNSHKGETLYAWGKTLPYVWKSIGSKKLQPKYEGDVEDGVPNGLGVLISTNGLTVNLLLFESKTVIKMTKLSLKL